MIDVVVGVIRDVAGRVLLTQRQEYQDFAHCWEFPGGKIEPGESAEQALQRELHEELSINMIDSAQLIEIPWHYAHKSICLHVYVVVNWHGVPIGAEGQKMRWVSLSELAEIEFPAANRGIVHALTLPSSYAITGTFVDLDDLLKKAACALERGAGLLQLRAKLTDTAYLEAAHALLPLVHAHKAKLLLNSAFSLWQACPEAGWHVASDKLASLTERPVPASTLLTASVHNNTQLQQAIAAGVDAVLVSPVLPTQSHPGAPALGWEVASSLVAALPVPAYALGGVEIADLTRAKSIGFQGIAGIGAFWHS